MFFEKYQKITFIA